MAARTFPRTATTRLAERRYVVAGDRAYLIGSGDGRFPPLGWHIRGEMGGLWAPPIKLLDGYWLTLDGRPLPAAQSLEVDVGQVTLAYPPLGPLELTRREAVPDGLPALLLGLAVRNRGRSTQTARLGARFRSKLLAPYPWTETLPRGAAAYRRRDRVVAVDDRFRFEQQAGCRCALVGSTLQPAALTLAAPPEAAELDPAALGGGAWGSLEWELLLAAGQTATVWVAVAGSHRSRADAETALARALADPPRQIGRKTAARRRLLAASRLTAGGSELAAAFDAGKLNLAELRCVVPGVQLRDVSGGRLRRPLNGTLELRGLGGGYPDYAHFFAGDACYAAYALAVCGQWQAALDHLCLLRDVSRAVNGKTGKVVHEIAFDGSVIYGTNADAGNLDETALLAVAAEVLWRWSGDRRFPDELYAFVRDGMRYLHELDGDGDGYPAGGGGVERDGAGEESLAVCVWTHEALCALERLARDRGERADERWAAGWAARIAQSFDRDWWLPGEGLYADSLDGGNRPLLQRHWIAALPLAAGLAPAAHAEAVLRRLESEEFSQPAGLVHTAEADRRVWTLADGVMALAEANYGRPEQALRYLRPIADAVDLEMPGALPELLRSSDYDAFGDLHDRLMFMQAWSAYGVHWPLVHSFLGIRPDAPRRRLAVMPSLPPSLPQLGIAALRIGDDRISVEADRDGSTLALQVDIPEGWQLQLGWQLPAGEQAASLQLDGVERAFAATASPAGDAVFLELPSAGRMRLALQLA